MTEVRGDVRDWKRGGKSSNENVSNLKWNIKELDERHQMDGCIYVLISVRWMGLRGDLPVAAMYLPYDHKRLRCNILFFAGKRDLSKAFVCVYRGPDLRHKHIYNLSQCNENANETADYGSI